MNINISKGYTQNESGEKKIPARELYFIYSNLLTLKIYPFKFIQLKNMH